MLEKLPKTKKKNKKRLGRGVGSGRGKTAGRGTKGQKARSKISINIGMGGASFVKRLPLYRGKFRNKPKRNKPLAINVKYLNVLPKNTIVDTAALIKNNIVDEKNAKKHGIKILGNGELEKPLTVRLKCSKSAVKKIEKAGGKVES